MGKEGWNVMRRSIESKKRSNFYLGNLQTYQSRKFIAFVQRWFVSKAHARWPKASPTRAASSSPLILGHAQPEPSYWNTLNVIFFLFFLIKINKYYWQWNQDFWVTEYTLKPFFQILIPLRLLEAWESIKPTLKLLAAVIIIKKKYQSIYW